MTKPMGRELVCHACNHAAIPIDSQSPVRAYPDGVRRLTEREIDVLELLLMGHANGTIAQILGISANTVKRYLSSAFIKLPAETRTQAAMIYRDWKEQEHRKAA